MKTRLLEELNMLETLSASRQEKPFGVPNGQIQRDI